MPCALARCRPAIETLGVVLRSKTNHQIENARPLAKELIAAGMFLDDWGKLLGDTAAITALLDRLLHHAHVLTCGPRSWRTKVQTDLRTEDATK